MTTQTQKHNELKEELKTQFPFARIKNYSSTTLGIYSKNKETFNFTLEEIEQIYNYLINNNIKSSINTIKESYLNEIASNGKRTILNLYSDGIKGLFK